MPSTLPTHPLAVLPLKLWRPTWFDGVALATGACAPDFAYALDGIGVRIPSHTILALLWWCLPTAVATAWLIRRGAPGVAVHLPAVLRDYGVLGRVRHRWYVTASSAVLGAVSHLLWDLVTHPGPIEHWWEVRQASDGTGLLLMPLLLWYVGRRHLLQQWHGAPPVVPARPARFWPVAAVVFVAGVLLIGALRADYSEHLHVLGVRLFATVTLALLAGAAAVQSAGAAHRTAPAAPLPPR